MNNFRSGTEFRSESGVYTLPDSIALPTVDRYGEVLGEPYPDRRSFVSVTTVLDRITDFSWPWSWWIAELVYNLAEAARLKESVPVWNDQKKEMVDVPAGLVLCNVLPADFGKNAGMHWVSKAGARELQRRANCGTIIHDAALDWCLGMVGPDAIGDAEDLLNYCGSLIEMHGFAIKPAAVVRQVAAVRAWLDRHVTEVLMAEAPVFSFVRGYAGTRDFVGRVRGLEADGIPDGSIVGIDFKGSKDWKVEHFLQAVAYEDADFVLVRGVNQLVPNYQCEFLVNLYVVEEVAKPYVWDLDYIVPARSAFGALLKVHGAMQVLETELFPRLARSGKVKVK